MRAWSTWASRSPGPDPAVVAEHPPGHARVSLRRFERGQAGRLDRDNLVPGPRRIAAHLDPGNPRLPATVSLVLILGQQVAYLAAAHLDKGW